MRLVGSASASSGMEPNSNGGGPGRRETHAAVLPIIRNGEQAEVRAPAPVQPSRRRAPALPALARQRRVHGPRRFAQGAVRDRDPAAQRHGGAAHGTRAQQRHPGRADSLRADARPGGGVAARHGPCRNRHAERRRAVAGRGGEEPRRRGARGVRRTGVGVRARDGQRDPGAAQGDRLLRRLEPHPLHLRPRILPGGARGVRAPVGGGTDLPRTPGNPLVPALPHRRVGRGGRVRRRDGDALLHPLSRGGRTEAVPHGRDHAPRDDAGRHGGRRASTRPAARPLRGLDRFEAREKIVQLLKAEGLLEKTEPHQHAVRHCYRCDTVVEPRLSDQWFVKMRPLAEPALAAYRSGEIRLVPERWGATYEHWMENIRDWNISRQLWWGHRIPVFNCTTCQHQWADREDPTRCPKCGGPVTQDPDVLDTWFSAWLWPFATFGWPERTRDLARFYPGHTLVTAPEILFFWVARMIMAGYHFMKAKPFATVYLHGTVRDAQNRKIAKTLGNGIDPIDVVKLYGGDALRWTVIGGGSLGADVILDPNDLDTSFAPGRNFANKLWNIGRFILAQLPQRVQPIDQFDRPALHLADRWILMRANEAVHAATSYLEQFKLDEAAKRCYEFVWGELADWYVEAVKPRLATASGDAAQAVLAHCFDTVLRLLHPVVPFITEELWQKLPGRKADELLATASWPTFRPELVDPDLDAAFLRVKQAVEKIRIIRAEYKVPPKTRLRASIKPRGRDRRSVFEAESETIKRLAQVEELTFDGGMKGPVAYAVFGDGSEVFVALEGAIDVQQECKRLSGEVTRLDRQLAALAAKLTNQDFVARAPADVVARERDKERAWRDQRRALADKLKVLGCS